eukprot:gene6482-13085_t
MNSDSVANGHCESGSNNSIEIIQKCLAIRKRLRYAGAKFLNISVFGEFEGSYCQSLSRTYFTYSSSIVISMITNHLIVEVFGFSHRDAWVMTMIWIGIYNYFMLKATWKKPKLEIKNSDKLEILSDKDKNFP